MMKLTAIAAITLVGLAGCDAPPPAQSPADVPPPVEPEVTEPEHEPEPEPEVSEPEAAPAEDPSPMLPPCEEHKKKNRCEISQGCAWDDAKKACIQHQEGL